MQAKGYLFLSINSGPIVSFPVRLDTDRIKMEFWCGDEDASTADPSVRAVVEGVLTSMADLATEQTITQN